MRQSTLPWFLLIKSLGLAMAAALLVTIAYAGVAVIRYWNLIGV
ncbi:hypothetical protein [Salinisphaera shabanensis]|jgi:hypothetical protein|nr:hypothetical protein [Salinisphaera shabanensis]